MKRIISGLPHLRQLITGFLVGIAILFNTTFSYPLSAQAQALTPEATQYEVNSPDSPFQPEEDNERGAVNNLAQTTKSNLENTADTIREKLNLDQPIYPGTKEFLNDIQDKTQETLQDINPMSK